MSRQPQKGKQQLLYGQSTEFQPCMQAVVEQVQRDHVLLRERIQRLGGPSGIKRLEAGLAAARAASSQSSSPAATPTPSPGTSPWPTLA